MKYKGYEAVIEYDAEDRLFFGRVINILGLRSLTISNAFE
jgi:predicted HicB family RNase H-like nuclease